MPISSSSQRVSWARDCGLKNNVTAMALDTAFRQGRPVARGPALAIRRHRAIEGKMGARSTGSGLGMLVAGTQLGRFEIRGLLGAGGMGEVYRARDSRLRRDVALKLLPQSFLGDVERAARFERETQVLASLNHPNIAALYEVVAVPGSHALVMELVEGQTLGEHIARGPLPVSEALGIAQQIAGALEAAHEQGIVHRDL